MNFIKNLLKGFCIGIGVLLIMFGSLGLLLLLFYGVHYFWGHLVGLEGGYWALADFITLVLIAFSLFYAGHEGDLF